MTAGKTEIGPIVFNLGRVTNELRLGDVVRFVDVVDEGDAEQRMVLIEEPDGGRVLVRHLGTGMKFAPTTRIPIEQLTKAGSVVSRLANTFSSLLVNELGAEVTVQIVERNEADGDLAVCHSHDFLDANEVMAEAWMEIFKFEIDPREECQIRMWGAAWQIARANHFHLVQEEWPDPANAAGNVPIGLY